MHTFVWVPKEVIKYLELELQVTVRYLMWELRTKSQASVGEVSTLNC